VVRNHEGGTGLRGWNPRSRSDGLITGAGVDAARGRRWRGDRHILRAHVARTCGRNPREKAGLPARAIGTAPERSEGEEVRTDGPFGERTGGRGAAPSRTNLATGERRGGRGRDQRPAARPGPGKTLNIAR